MWNWPGWAIKQDCGRRAHKAPFLRKSNCESWPLGHLRGSCTGDWPGRKTARARRGDCVRLLHPHPPLADPQWAVGLDQLPGGKHRDGHGMKALVSYITPGSNSTAIPSLKVANSRPKSVAPSVWFSSSQYLHGYYRMDIIQQLLRVYLAHAQNSVVLGAEGLTIIPFSPNGQKV